MTGSSCVTYVKFEDCERVPALKLSNPVTTFWQVSGRILTELLLLAVDRSEVKSHTTLAYRSCFGTLTKSVGTRIAATAAILSNDIDHSSSLGMGSQGYC